MKKMDLRVIAIGGMGLSRGLTLEGLVISYFHRNSKMYDTLMQWEDGLVIDQIMMICVRYG